MLGLLVILYLSLSLSLSLSLRVSLSLSSPSVHPPSSYLTSLSHIIFKNMVHVRSFSHFVFVIVFVFVFALACVFVIVLTGASVNSTCHKLSENIWAARLKTYLTYLTYLIYTLYIPYIPCDNSQRS